MKVRRTAGLMYATLLAGRAGARNPRCTRGLGASQEAGCWVCLVPTSHRSSKLLPLMTAASCQPPQAIVGSYVTVLVTEFADRVSEAQIA